LTIYGTVNGDVLVVGGDLQMKHSGKITGNARVINGSITREKGAVIEGYEDKKSTKKTSYRESHRKFSKSGRSFDVPWLDEQMNLDNFIFRYNRVESIFLGIGTERKFYWDGERNWNGYGSIGWGFKSHTWRGNLGLARQFAILSTEGNGIIELGAEGYSLTDSKDQWIISLPENTASALLIHEDFRNYYERIGYSLHTAYYSKHDYLKSELKLTYLADTYDSLSNVIEWAVFGGNKRFRRNPIIHPGKMRSVIASGGVSTISKTSDGSEGWSLFASTEFAKRSCGSEFEFDQYIVDLRRFQPLGRYDNLNVRLRVGSSGGTLPLQKLYELGGLGTISAFPFKSDIGNRMLLVNAEFILNGNFLDELDFWPTWLFQHFNFLLTSDAGFTRWALPTASALEGFESVKWNDFKHSFGAALANRSGSFRIGLTWRTDHPAPAQFLLRFSRPF
jgi:hypothetical protein